MSEMQKQQDAPELEKENARRREAKAPCSAVWIVLYNEPDTQRSGIHGVFAEESSARLAANSCNRTMRAVYRAEKWSLIVPNVKDEPTERERSELVITPTPWIHKLPQSLRWLRRLVRQ